MSTHRTAAVSCVRRIVDGAVERYADGASSTQAFVDSVRCQSRAVTPANTETAAALWVAVVKRVDSRARVLPTRTAGGQFRTS